MTAVYFCECKHLPPDHHGSTYACRKPRCRCVRYTPDFKRPVEPSRVLDEILARATRAEIEAAEPEPDTLSTSARLAKAEQERDAIGVKLVAALRECNQFREALASARDDRDYFKEATRVAHKAIDEVSATADLLRAELATARTELEHLREHQEIRARVIREKNAELLRAAKYAKSLGELSCPDPAVHTANLIVARDGGRYCERCEQEIRRGEAYELQPGTGGLLLHIRCPITEGNPHA